MWTKQHRKTYKRSDERYPSALTDAEWSHLEPLIPPAEFSRSPYSVSVELSCCNAKNFSLPSCLLRSNSLWQPAGVDGAMRPLMIIHGYRPVRIGPFAVGRNGSGG